MKPNFAVFACVCLGFTFICSLHGQGTPSLRAGASAIDVTPTFFPVIQNGGFLEGQIQLATEKLYARCLALDDGETRLAMVIVDSCMIPRTFCDEAKTLASQSTGLPKDKILIAATHTHSAPSVMDFCLGSRADPRYSAFLLPKIVESIESAVARLETARAAWAVVDAGEYTNCRRWITRADALQEDPFGERTVRAMMHPGYQNPDFTGPSGPKDPWLSFLSVRSAEGRPLALLGNFSMHYFSGHAGASADYFGHFSRQIAERLAPGDDDFIGMLSQGTSGDLWWADYSQPKVERDIAEYSKALVDLALEAEKTLTYRSDLSLAMAESRTTLRRRTPDEKRLAWAREMLETMEGRRPRNRPEVYAEQAVYLHENPTEEIVLQAIRVGELGITAMPNEVYGLTGLKVKHQSPLETTFVVELANGAAGYIPPPEQHALGGYNTWPARTAGLEVEAEPKIVEGVFSLLEKVTGLPRKVYNEPETRYAENILALKPLLYWRLAEMQGPEARDVSGNGHDGTFVGMLAYHLPGVQGPAFGGEYASRCLHLAGGHVSVSGEIVGDQYTLMLWLWNGILHDVEEDMGFVAETGEALGIAGKGEDAGKLFVAHDGKRFLGGTVLEPREWHHVTLVADKDNVRVYLNGLPQAEIDVALPNRSSPEVIRIGRGFQGKVDEVAIYDRALTGDAVSALYAP